jgi:hypothetical protein
MMFLMESSPESKSPRSFFEAAAAYVSSLKSVGKTLSQTDLNPHEGRLRASAMPVKYMNIPDYAPNDDFASNKAV